MNSPRLIEILPPAEIRAFASESDLFAWLGANPCVRNVGRILRPARAPGERVALLVTYPDAKTCRDAELTADRADRTAKRAYSAKAIATSLKRRRQLLDQI